MILKKWSLIVLAILGTVIVLQSCEDDLGEVGAGLVDDVNFETFMFDASQVKAYTTTFSEGVQTNNMTVGAVGVYADPVFGETKSNVLSRVSLSNVNPDFGEDPKLERVVFRLPYFSDLEETDADGNSTYTLDSIFGNNPMKIEVFRSDYFLSDLNASQGLDSPALYFNTDLGDSDGVGAFPGIESELLFSDVNFTPSAEEIVYIDTDADGATSTVRVAPELRIEYDADDTVQIDYWTAAILADDKKDFLLNQNLFQDYFRGIYIKATPINDSGSYILFDYDDVNIELFYSSKVEDAESGDDAERTTSSIRLDLDYAIAANTGVVRGVQVLGISEKLESSISQEIAMQNENENASSLYLKGGNPTLGIIDLFGERNSDGSQDQLEILRSCGVIINEANLILNVDQQKMSASMGELEPERLFLYDFDNSQTLIDYSFDRFTDGGLDVNAKINHLGRLNRSEEGNTSSAGVNYKLRITQHINNVINNDSTNVKLAVGVSQNVSNIRTLVINDGVLDVENLQRIPEATVVSPEGTIIHGSSADVDDENKLKLRISYTVPKGVVLSEECKSVLGIN